MDWKKNLIAVIFLSAATLPAKADNNFVGFQSGNELLRDCSSGKIACYSYIQGVIDAEAYSKIRLYCLRDRVEAGQLAAVVAAYLAAHPAALDFNAAALVKLALAGPFPCG